MHTSMNEPRALTLHAHTHTHTHTHAHTHAHTHTHTQYHAPPRLCRGENELRLGQRGARAVRRSRSALQRRLGRMHSSVRVRDGLQRRGATRVGVSVSPCAPSGMRRGRTSAGPRPHRAQAKLLRRQRQSPRSRLPTCRGPAAPLAVPDARHNADPVRLATTAVRTPIMRAALSRGPE